MKDNSGQFFFSLKCQIKMDGGRVYASAHVHRLIIILNPCRIFATHISHER